MSGINLAEAFSNNDVILLVWTYDQPIADCLGFSISRRNKKRERSQCLKVIVGAQELKDDFAFWMAELLKSSSNAYAIIHDKILVLDAFTDQCVVITGRHNQGYRASYNNDETCLSSRETLNYLQAMLPIFWTSTTITVALFFVAQ